MKQKVTPLNDPPEPPPDPKVECCTATATLSILPVIINNLPPPPTHLISAALKENWRYITAPLPGPRTEIRIMNLLDEEIEEK